MIGTRCHREWRVVVSKCCSHPTPSIPGQPGLHPGSWEESCLGMVEAASSSREVGGHSSSSSLGLPTTTLSSQCVKCCVEHYPDRLRATNESTGFPLWLGSALRSNRGHSIHSVPWPQTAVGHRPLEAQVCSPGKVTPCFYMAGGSSMVSPLSVRDPHNTCGWAPNP